MFTRPSTRLAATLTALITVAACGGGGTTPPPGGNPPAGNHAPTVEITELDPVMELTNVTLTAKGEDGDGDTLTYSWIQTGGTPVEITRVDGTDLSFNAPKVKNHETLTFELKVDDGNNPAVTEHVDVVIEEANGVVYAAVEETAYVEHVYFHHPAFERSVRLSVEPPVSDTPRNVLIRNLQLAPDHKYVVYTVDTVAEDGPFLPIRLFVAALDGSSVHDLSGEIVPGGDVRTVKVSPDGRWIAFRGDLETNGLNKLFIVPLDGSIPRREISGEIPEDSTGNGVSEFFYWSPDSTRIVFGGALRSDDRQDVFVASVTGEEPVLISDASTQSNKNDLFSIADPNFGPFAWSPDGELIAFVEHASESEPVFVAVNSRDGNRRRRILDAAGFSTSPSDTIQMAWSSLGKLAVNARMSVTSIPDREVFIYMHTDPDTPAAPVGGALSGGSIDDIQWSPNGEALAFLHRISSQNTGVFLTPASSTNSNLRIRIDGQTEFAASSAALGSGQSWLSDSSSLLFRRRLSGQSAQIFSYKKGDFEPIAVSGDPVSVVSSGPLDFCPSPTTNAVVYTANLEGDGVIHTYVSSTDGTERRAVTGRIIMDDPETSRIELSNSFLVSDCWSANGSEFLMRGDLEQDGIDQLFMVSAASVDGNDRIRVSNVLEEFDADGFPRGYVLDSFWVGPDPE